MNVQAHLAAQLVLHQLYLKEKILSHGIQIFVRDLYLYYLHFNIHHLLNY